jgi:hypothetical protein
VEEERFDAVGEKLDNLDVEPTEWLQMEDYMMQDQHEVELLLK